MLLNNIEEPIIATDREFNITFWNKGAQKIFRFLPEEVLGKEVSAVLRLMYTTEGMKEMKTALFHEKKWRGQLEYKSKSGKELIFDVSLATLHNGSGEKIGYVGLHRNITAHKQAEAALSDALAREFQLRDMKSRFVVMASHQFRTPFSTILSSSNLIEKYTAAEQQPNRIKHINRIKEAIHHMDAILEDFLSLSRLEEGKVSVMAVSFEVRALVMAIIAELDFIRKQNQEIHYTHEGEDRVVTDKRLVRHIIVNLVSNAIKFSEEKQTIRIRSRAQHQKLCVEVADEGIGISKEDQKHLFESFFRGKNAQCIEGTGLGLHIAKRYAHMLQGDIQVKSVLGKGTTASLTL